MDDSKTPVDHMVRCDLCGGPIVLIANWIPGPQTREEAWTSWSSSCVSIQSRKWTWCVVTSTYRGPINVTIVWPRLTSVI